VAVGIFMVGHDAVPWLESGRYNRFVNRLGHRRFDEYQVMREKMTIVWVAPSDVTVRAAADMRWQCTQTLSEALTLTAKRQQAHCATAPRDKRFCVPTVSNPLVQKSS